jgi:hypothetical protein
MITRYIAELLYSHECVIVPGLGGFIKSNGPAWILHFSNEFHPPTVSIAFNAALSANDGQLANYVAASKNITYSEALFEIKAWVDACNVKLIKDKKFQLEGIGELFINASGKLEFLPSKLSNFNADSFGLPVFTAIAVKTESLEVPDIEPASHNSRTSQINRLIPETLKWAAVLAPFIAFALWGSLKGNIINNYIHNYTGMYSWVRSTPGKTAPVANPDLSTAVKEKPVVKIESPAGILANENISFDPGLISYTELAKQNITISEIKPLAAADLPAVQETSFHIVGGAFRDHDNALKLIKSLDVQGYSASIIDTTPGGLYVVSMIGFKTRLEAEMKLREIKNNGFSTSWIMKKQKVYYCSN